MSDLSGKSIAIDISIYLYKYESEDLLLENMYLMLSIFRNYNITPLFIFDGKPPPEKKALLIKRREDREEAKQEYDKLKKQLEDDGTKDDGTKEKDDEIKDDNDKHDIITAMDQLKKQFIYINKEKIESVKELIRAYGASYYDAPGEADELCALLVIKKKVWACLSEDMDMFVYGCPRVLRYFSLINHTTVLYYMKGILEELDVTQKEFREICILSGTDYNINANGNSDNITLYQTLKLFSKFKSSNTESNEFYDWLKINTLVISDIDLLIKINNIFDSKEISSNLELFKKIKIINGPIIYDSIKNIMMTEGFIFVD
jgi:5'-3' exonuclease